MSQTKILKIASVIVVALLLHVSAATAQNTPVEPGKPVPKPPAGTVPPNRVEMMQAWKVVLDYPKFEGKSPNGLYQVAINCDGVRIMGRDKSIGVFDDSWISISTNSAMNPGGERLPAGSYKLKMRFYNSPNWSTCKITMHKALDAVGRPDAAVLASKEVPPGTTNNQVQEIEFVVPVNASGHILVSFKVDHTIEFIGATLEKVGMSPTS
jgi:hypothetical protein